MRFQRQKFQQGFSDKGVSRYKLLREAVTVTIPAFNRHRAYDLFVCIVDDDLLMIGRDSIRNVHLRDSFVTATSCKMIKA